MTENDNPDMPDLDGFLALETRVWEALVVGDAVADAALLTPDFLGVYPDGFADRAAHAAQLSDGPSIRRFGLDRARLRPLGPDRALLCYRARYVRAGSEREEEMYVSSLWERRGRGWRNSFSQDTPAAD